MNKGAERCALICVCALVHLNSVVRLGCRVSTIKDE